ncbi:MAG: GH36-type glycosyl hydrolase domain-containing protein [Clostridium sp.]
MSSSNKTLRKNVLSELKSSFQEIKKDHKYIKTLSKDGEELLGSAEWLLDNIYLIEKEYKNIKENMPIDYFTNLPPDEAKKNEVNPRIYIIAKDYVNKKEGVVEEKDLVKYINNRNTKLTMGELWAFPLMLRSALIVNLSKITKRLTELQKEKIDGKKFAINILERKNKEEFEGLIEEIKQKDVIYSPIFVIEAIKILKDNSIENKEIYIVIKEKLEDKEEEALVKNIFLEGALESKIGSIIKSLREVEAANWKAFFENTSQVEKILNSDPSNVYKKMDFKSKDYYRHKIESISRKFQVDEVVIAEKVVYLSNRAKEVGKRSCSTHVGYYLIDVGVEELVKSFKAKCKIKNTYSEGKFITYILLATLSIIAITLGITNVFSDTYTINQYIIIGLILLIPSSEIALVIINRYVGKLIPLRHIPKLDYSNGIPIEDKTIVIIPTITSSANRIKELMERLEVFYLGNKDENIYYVLLNDFSDSKEEEDLRDKEVISQGIKSAQILNKKYFNGKKHFFYLNRKRIYNKKENIFMGKERKRGKIIEFIALLKGEEDHSFNVISSPITHIQNAKYIITLDSDTFLPREMASSMIGAMSHILNKPKVVNGIVKRGYGIMQPKVTISYESKNKTQFSEIFGGDEGVDGYSTAYSDTYEDLFAEGTFTGKGIIEINTFYSILKNKFPENRILSHDLIEGAYTRCALISDVEVIDGYPSTYEASCKRIHRWVRGDWQIGSWIFSKKISLISKWKIFDNLRRSLLAPSILLAVVISLTILKGIATVSILCLLIFTIPIMFTITDFVVTPKVNLNGTIKSLKESILILSFTPYQAYLMCDAIIRTLFRLTISKKKLLQWASFEDVEKKSSSTLSQYYTTMWFSSIFSIVVIGLGFNINLLTGLSVLPIAILWSLSPYLAHAVSQSKVDKERDLSGEEIEYLRILSRRIWAYYEDFVNEENNFLAPDNYQELPYKGVAHRTSPTNIGMGLISNLVAYDLGYIPLGEVIDRLELTIESMDKLEKYNGHFLNWYDTSNLNPLWPRYVSTVDSGNLLAYLFIIKEALEEYKHNPLIRKKEISSLKDGFEILETIQYENLNSKIELKEYIPFLEEILNYLKDINFDNEEQDYWSKKIQNEIKLKISYYDYLFEGFEKLLLDEYKEEFPSIVELIEHLSEVMNSSGEEFKELLSGRINCLTSFLNRIDILMGKIGNIIKDMSFKCLYNYDRGLFSIGYNLEENSLGNSYYDLLASEARCASFLAIATWEVPKSHWFNLGRAISKTFSNKSLVSWSGTMFEYFMPSLIMKNYKGTLLDLTYDSVIKSQKAFGQQKKVPWGISESAYYKFDVAENYQYKAFGVPGIGLKRGLEDELVVSPYSTIMVIPFDKHEGIDNLIRLEKLGAVGRYGFIESIDYTPNRINTVTSDEEEKENSGREVRCYMVHHLGMSLMALNNTLNKNIFQERFHRIPEIKATELLLKERIPTKITYEREENYTVAKGKLEYEPMVPRVHNNPLKENEEVLLLSNGSYSTMINLTGGGYSKKEDTFLYRWNGDSTTDNSGMFFYVKNLNSNDYWSATYEPTKTEGDNYNIEFFLDKAKYKRSDGSIETETEIVISPEDDLEIRKLTFKNIGSKSRRLEITSYMEVIITTFESDAVHPTFSNLFITTEYNEEEKCLLANRRPRAKKGKSPYVFHKLVSMDELPITYETSRLNFIGRNRDLKSPSSMDNDATLSNTVGAVLDPILSIRSEIELLPEEIKTIYFITGITENKNKALELTNKYDNVKKLEKTFLSYNKAISLELKALGIRSPQGNLYQSLSSYIFYLHSGRKDREHYIKTISKNQQDLWPYGISGDLPILMLLVKDDNELDLVRWMVKLHYYWRIKGVKTDLIIYNEEEFSYDEPLQKNIMQIISLANQGDSINKPSGIFIHNKSTMGEDIRNLLIGISAFYVDGTRGSIINQINEIDELDEDNFLRHKELEDRKILKPINSQSEDYSIYIGEKLEKTVIEEYKIIESSEYDEEELLFYNGYGGFIKDEGAYLIRLKEYKNTPAPWINVISNENFGFHVSESGSSYTWFGNSRENKITPWNNDPIKDNLGEALYIRDDVSGQYFSITPEPIRDGGVYKIKHGFGYSKFEHSVSGIRGEYTLFTPMNENLKIGKVKLKNQTDKKRELSVFYYAQMVMGVHSYGSRRYITTKVRNNYIMASNPYSKYFGEEKAYLTIIGGESYNFLGDRKEFIGRGKDLSNPKALEYKTLNNKTGGIYDPALICQSKVILEANEEKEVYVLLGVESSTDNIEKHIVNYSKKSDIDIALEATKKYWQDFLGTIKVKTKDESFNLLINGWLLYQNLSCRYWSRTAFYQSGGAYGFRDQLQDSMALGVIKPEIMREQILRSASRQYVEGDVQHWWHPVINSGIRTRFSDDLLWLPYVTSEYINITGDYDILNEKVSYLEDEPLRDGEDERYTIVNNSSKYGTVYEHCIKAIDRGLRFGEHNIPLMGSGDWNDGMSTVGNEGKGESVWLGWFLYSILDSFEKLSEKIGDVERKNKFIESMEFIRENIEKNAWDGGWYRRAYFDDGTPLGSRENEECKIDSLAQSWSVISGAAKEERALEAMEAVDKNLVKDDKGIILLLYPPFEKSRLEPGYIKGYVAGVRENGGQYTHAAVWVILALTKLGMGDKAFKYFNMINPINHSSNEISAQNYKVEPYVMAADVYLKEPHGGRGGWSWYTGAAGWMYRVGIENILGLKNIKGEGYSINPCVPSEWKEFQIEIKNKTENYAIKVIKGSSKKIIINDVEIEGELIPKNLGDAKIEIYY